MLSPWNVCDALAFLPPLLETLLVLCGSAAAPGSLLRGYDMRFFKLLRYEHYYSGRWLPAAVVMVVGLHGDVRLP